MTDDMKNLLKWSLNAAHNPSEAGNPDPKLVAQLFGAPDDVTMMKEELRAAIDSQDKDERLECLDKFDEYVSKLDNANNIGTLWEPLLYLANEADPEISGAALTCISTAVQNNEKSQNDLVATKSGVPLLIAKCNDPDVAPQALLALSSALGNCEKAYEQFVAANGWDLVATVVSDYLDTADDRPEKIRGRVLSLLNSIVLLAPHVDVQKELDRLSIVPKLQALEPKESVTNREKIEHILKFLEEHPKSTPRAVQAI